MRSDTGRTTSIWMETVRMPDYPALGHDTDADVCVVGAGIAGLTTAYHLLRAGRGVVVLEDGAVGGGETGRTTAHLSSALDDRFSSIEDELGEEKSRLAAGSHAAAIDRIERIVREEAIDCDFARLDGWLFLGPEHGRDLLERELAAAHRAGLAGVELLERAPLRGFDTGPCLRFSDQAQLHPLRYLRGLAAAVERLGGRIHTGTHVASVQGGDPVVVETDRGVRVTARAAVEATNAPITDRFQTPSKQAPYRTFAIGLRVPAGAVPPGLYWDTADPYHYVRLQPMGDHEVLIVGGADHRTGEADDGPERFAALEAWTRGRFPGAGPVVHRWSGQVLEPADLMAFIGRNPHPGQDNVYLATGDSGHGMTHGTIAGMLLTDLINGVPNPWTELYDPARITVSPGSLEAMVRGGLEVARHFVADRVVAPTAPGAAAIEPGSGALLQRDGRTIAAYRDPDGVLHERSASCTHLGCTVRWNSLEGSWDCPCHGSRFGPLGQVLNGPAAKRLEALD